MIIALPPEIIATVISANRRHYRLPQHNLRPLGWPFILFSLFTAGIIIGILIFSFTLGLATFPFQELFQLSSPIEFLIGLFFLFGMFFFVLFPLPFFLIGLWFYAGHFEIESSNNSLIRIFRVGPLQFSNRRSLCGLQQFTVARFGQSENTGQSENSGHFYVGLGPVSMAIPFGESNPSDERSLLLAEWAGGKRLILAFGYPRRLMLPLANELSQYCQLQPNAPVPHVIEESLDPEEILERLEQPAHSTAILEQHLDGVTITLPALGWRRTWGSFPGIFTLLWFFSTAIFSALFIPALLAGQVEGDAWVGWILLPMFWLMGIGLLLFVLHGSKYSTVLTVTKDSLAILETGLFGKNKHEWFRKDLENVGVVSESSKDSRGTHWTTRLRIQPKEGTPYQFLSWQDKAELEWLATVLRQALNLQFKQFSNLSQQLTPDKPPSPISRLANGVINLVIIFLSIGGGWEIREGVNKAGETVVLRNGPIFLWYDAPDAADKPEAKQYVSIKTRRWSIYGDSQSNSSYRE